MFAEHDISEDADHTILPAAPSLQADPKVLALWGRVTVTQAQLKLVSCNVSRLALRRDYALISTRVGDSALPDLEAITSR